MPHSREIRVTAGRPWRAQISLGMKLTLSLLLLAVTAGGLVGWFLVAQTAKGYREGHQREAVALAGAVAADLGAHASHPDEVEDMAARLLADVASLRAVRVTLEGEGGPILWVSTVTNETGRPVPQAIRDAETSGRGQTTIDLMGEEVLQTTRPLEIDGVRVGTVAVYTSLTHLHEQVTRQGVILIAVIILAIVGSVGVGSLLLRRQVLLPLRRLAGSASRVAAGDLSVPPPRSVEPGRNLLNQLAAEIDNMIRSVDARTRQQAAVADLGRLIVEGAQLDTLLAATTTLMTNHLDVELSSALELSADGRRLSFRAGSGWPDGIEMTDLPAGGSVVGAALATGEPVVVDDLADERDTPSRAMAQGARSALSVVVRGREHPWGVLIAYSLQPKRFQREDALYLTALAGTLGSAIESRRAQTRLERAEAKYRLLVERVPAITYIAEFGLDGRWSFVSPQVESMLGYTPDEWLADPGLWGRSLHPDDRDAALEHEASARSTGEPLSSDYRLIARDGREVWIRDEGVIQSDEDGRRVLQGIMYDVTEQRLAEHAEQEARTQYQALVEQVPAVVYIDARDEPSTALYMSPHVESLTGYSVEEWLEDPQLWTRSLHPDDADQVLALSRSTNASGEPFLAEYRLRRRDGEYRWVRDEAALVRSPDGTTSYWQGIFYDITDRRAAEEALRQSFERERDVAERLRAIDEMKNAFLAAVSHELRTPLSSVLGYALTLERPDLDVSVEERRDMTHRLAVNARKLERLLSDLLDLDRLARGVLEPQRRSTDMPELVQRVLDETELRGRHIDVAVDPIRAEVDAPKVERIVENLLVNAVKHTPPETAVRLAVESREDGVEIRVEDDGPGISDQLKGDVFEPFRQGSEEHGPVPGTGIGLSLVARFAELHGGRAWVQDGAGGGASFRVSIPCIVTASGEAPAPV